MKPETPTKIQLKMLIRDLADALARYGYHDPNCQSLGPADLKCTCGYTEKIFELDQREQEMLK